ncbi:MAG: flagellar biosynthesis protein FlhF, partial [Lachnospiraceae bacterium]|nr:flagellar biosynthesis protein FlhF [Lachnospiraceae bacterium]
MLIKKLQAPTEKEALEQAKKELGKDVIITHMKKIQPKGLAKLFKKGLVEITAAVDEDKVYEKKIPAHNNAAFISSTPIGSSSGSQFEMKNAADAYTNGKMLKEPSAIEQKLDTLSTMIEKQLGSKEKVVKEEQESELESKSPSMSCIQMIYNQMVNNEVEEVYANKVISE